jgi:hypothetical protein
MATTQTGKTESMSTRTGAAGGGMDAIQLLEQDHREVEKMFQAFESAQDEDMQAQLSQQICTALKVHTQIEEELFYPMARDELDKPDMVEEAIVEHQAAKELIGEIEQMEPGEELFEARMKVLSEQIEHHVKEEEGELFPACRKAGMELDRLGRQMAERKQALMTRMDAGMADGGSRAH